MFKSLFISLNLIALVLVPFIYLQEVTVNCEAANEMDINGNNHVTITINKGSITGPARLKLDFSEATGLTAEEISSGGASFSFNEDNAMYVWYDIPSEETVTLKYSISASAGSEGLKTIKGTFSYLDETERQTMEIPEVIFEVKSGNGTVTSNEVSNISSTQQTGLPNVTGTRSITKEGDNFIVNVAINKEDGSGFGRLKEDIPPGFDVEKINTSGSVFKFVDNTVKFLWTSIKSDEPNISVSYKLIPTNAVAGDYSIEGAFSGEFLIVDDKPQSITIAKTTFTFDGTLANNGNQNGNDNGNQNGNDNGNQNGNDNGNQNGNDNGNQNANDNGNQNGNETTIETHSGTAGISYRVQVLAAHKTVDSKYIKKRYNGYNKKLNLESHEGWVKYTTSGMETYKKARDHRESLGNYKFPGPFVTAYNEGERITVQEALMLSSQTWVQ